ncbi:HAD hydrolase-like protein [Nonomuraea sp. NPDC005692]|uniref:HAD hydrolase-like protein n=1 Tax=Nonomuraea sp. NPDC005692 TaxID=3157168 RepID=UPI0034017CB4
MLPWTVWLCDLDGTLVDSAPAHEAAFRHALAEHAPGALESFRYADHAGASTAAVAARLTGDPAAAGRLARRAGSPTWSRAAARPRWSGCWPRARCRCATC